MSPQKEPHSIAMETSAPKETIKAPIYTHGSYWGGPQAPYWLFLLLTALPFTGFFGLDHLLFRSPSTALAKGVTNIFTLGLWYFYDILQAFNDKEFIDKYGLSKPAVGPAGLALGYFRDIVGKGNNSNQSGGGDNDKDGGKSGLFSILLFIFYVFTIFVPFGVSNFVAGDTSGGVVKMILSLAFPFSLFWFPYFFVGSFFELYRVLFSPDTLFEKGVLRIPPLNFVMAGDGFAPNIMNPKALQAEAQKAADDTFYNNWIKPLLSWIPFMDIIDTTKCQVVPPVMKTVDAAQKAGQGVIGIAKTIPEIASKSAETISAFTDPEKLKELAKAQSGGGLLVSGNNYYDWIVAGGLLLLVVGGFGAGILRKYVSSNKNDEPTLQVSTTDTPPNPGRV